MMMIGILLFVVGIVMLARPTFIWNMTESWKSNDATEPSDLYRLSTRFGGVVCVLVGVGAMIALSL